MSKREKSDHFDGERFFNPGVKVDKSFADLLRWQWQGGRADWPEWVENTIKPRLPSRVEPREVHLSFINHITYLMQFNHPFPGRAGTFNVLTDPVFATRIGPLGLFGPKRVRAPALKLEELPPVDVILLSHNHYDHMDLESLAWLREKFGSKIITPLENAKLMGDTRDIVELDWWEEFALGDYGKVTCVPAQHWSARGVGDRNKALWSGFVLEYGGMNIYFAGDTGYGRHFKEIRARIGEPDVSLLPIGAYEPRWFMKEQHMNPADAVQAHLDLGSRFSVGTHYGCFRLTNESIEQPILDLQKALRERGMTEGEFVAPETGATLIHRR